MEKLTPKQQLFVQEYVVDLNATQAAIRAGYSRKTACKIGSENLQKPDIQAAIAEYQKERFESIDLSAEMVLKEMARIAFVDIRKAFDENGNLLSIPDLPEDIARAIAGIDVSTWKEKGEDGGEEVTKKIKLIDKRPALESLGKHFKLFTDRMEHLGKDGKELFSETDEFEFARRVAFILESGLQSDDQCH